MSLQRSFILAQRMLGNIFAVLVAPISEPATLIQFYWQNKTKHCLDEGTQPY